MPILEGKYTWQKYESAKKLAIGAGNGAVRSHIKVLQINLDRIRAAHDLLVVTVKENDIDVAIIAEPNRKIAQARGWVTDRRGDSTVIVYNKQIQAKVVAQGDGFVALRLSGITIYSCYFSPNCSFQEFEHDLNDLFESIKSQRGAILVAGDFNAASKVWSNKTENARGRCIMDMLAYMDMITVNVGFAPTFQRGAKNSTPDITIVSPGLAQRVADWQVLDEDSLSGHRYIKFHISQDECQTPRHQQKGWRLDRLDRNVLEKNLKEPEISTPEQLVIETTRACDKAMPKKGLRRKAPVYWWNVEIQQKREHCTSCRRKYTRERRKKGEEDSKENAAIEEEIQKLKEEYKTAKIALQLAITHSKAEEWRKLCEEIDHDAWGLGYKIVAKKLRQSPPSLDMDLIKSVVQVLFPCHDDFGRIIAYDSDLAEITEEEVKKAAEELKPKKAPGPDLLCPEVVKLAVQIIPDKIKRIIHTAFASGTFPAYWKIASLVLLKKANKPSNEPTGYRPVCLLDCYGKLMERILLNRIEKVLPDHGGLSDHQYGFRQGRSTLMAVKKVLESATKAKQGSTKTRRLCALICLDVRNAFNSASWREILLEIRKRGFPGYMQNLISSYLEDRFIKVKDNKGLEDIVKITSGVPQGSILGPTLWNILYDGIFRLKQEEGIQLIGFADDLALVVVAKTEAVLITRANRALERISTWMLGKQLALAPEKTEAIVFSGRRRLDPITFLVQGTPVRPKEHVKYLGIWFDKCLNFKKHIEEVANKAQKTTDALYRLMPSKGGPRASKRRVLASVAHSVILYGAPIFKEALRIDLYRKKLEVVQRRLAIGISGAYRTVSTEAVLVIAGLIPIAKLVKERAKLFESQEETLNEVRENTLTEWEKEWAGAGKGTWTRELIKDLKRWHKRKHGEVDRWVTQALSGHGVFNTYLFKIGKAPSAKCFFCEEEDTPRHAIFECSACEDLRLLAQGTSGRVNSQSLVARMTTTEDEWHRYSHMLRAIMTRREKREKQEKENREKEQEGQPEVLRDAVPSWPR